jgi:hypothetical protein
MASIQILRKEDRIKVLHRTMVDGTLTTITIIIKALHQTTTIKDGVHDCVCINYFIYLENCQYLLIFLYTYTINK